MMRRRLKGMFQSHNGAIAARGRERIVGEPIAFQSHNGAIAAPYTHLRHLPEALVSIPQWCDCCMGGQTLPFLGALCFNPTMVRLLLDEYFRKLPIILSFNPTMVRLLH